MLFHEYDIKVYSVISKSDSWFVKFDEDAMPDFKTLKERLKNLSNSIHEKLEGKSDFFLSQFDSTEEFGGFLYAKSPASFIKELGNMGLKRFNDYHSTSLSLNMQTQDGRRLKIYNKTMHPLFAADSVSKRIGMGGKQFFQSS